MTPTILDHNPHATSEASIIYAVWLEIWPDLLAILGAAAVLTMVIMILVEITKAKRRGMRRRGDE